MKNTLLALAAFLVLSMGAVTTGCSSKDADPVTPTVAGPTITVTAPADNKEYSTGATIQLSGVFTSISNLARLSATVAYKSVLVSGTLRSTSPVRILKGTSVKWAATKDLALTAAVTQTLTDEVLFVAIPADAEAGNYSLTLVVTDVANKSATKVIPFVIL